jgi:hypothetical protein
MKNNYVKPEWEIITIATQDIITVSGPTSVNQFIHDPEDILGDDLNLDKWEW